MSAWLLDDSLTTATDPVADCAALMEQVFDIDAIRALLSYGGFRMRFDAMHAVTGPYAKVILRERRFISWSAR